MQLQTITKHVFQLAQTTKQKCFRSNRHVFKHKLLLISLRMARPTYYLILHSITPPSPRINHTHKSSVLKIRLPEFQFCMSCSQNLSNDYSTGLDDLLLHTRTYRCIIRNLFYNKIITKTNIVPAMIIFYYEAALRVRPLIMPINSFQMCPF